MPLRMTARTLQTAHFPTLPQPLSFDSWLGRVSIPMLNVQARSCVDCPTLQAVGPQATNQAVKAIAIARTFLKQSESIDICMQPTFVHLEDGHTGILIPPPHSERSLLAIRSISRRILSECVPFSCSGMLLQIRKKTRRATGEGEAQQLKAASGTDSKVFARLVVSVTCPPIGKVKPPMPCAGSCRRDLILCS